MVHYQAAFVEKQTVKAFLVLYCKKAVAPAYPNTFVVEYETMEADMDYGGLLDYHAKVDEVVYGRKAVLSVQLDKDYATVFGDYSADVVLEHWQTALVEKYLLSLDLKFPPAVDGHARDISMVHYHISRVEQQMTWLEFDELAVLGNQRSLVTLEHNSAIMESSEE